MYKLGTTLIFTSLTQASAAADLWGGAVESLMFANGNDYDDDYLRAMKLPKPIWAKGFKPEYDFIGIQEPHLRFYLPRMWRIILDTEEKLGWFTPQVGDLVATDDNIRRYVQGYPDIIQVKKTDKIRYWDETGLPFIHTDGGSALDVKRIIERQGKPFPTPQEVVEP